jgi:hypothetical protein
MRDLHDAAHSIPEIDTATKTRKDTHPCSQIGMPVEHLNKQCQICAFVSCTQLCRHLWVPGQGTHANQQHLQLVELIPGAQHTLRRAILMTCLLPTFVHHHQMDASILYMITRPVEGLLQHSNPTVDSTGPHDTMLDNV